MQFSCQNHRKGNPLTRRTLTFSQVHLPQQYLLMSFSVSSLLLPVQLLWLTYPNPSLLFHTFLLLPIYNVLVLPYRDQRSFFSSRI